MPLGSAIDVAEPCPICHDLLDLLDQIDIHRETPDAIRRILNIRHAIMEMWGLIVVFEGDGK